MDFLDFISKLRFGVEIELNSFDLKSKPNTGVSPKGIEDIAILTKKSVNSKVLISNWKNNHNNNNWFVKPDSSCGLEICSPILKGVYGIKKVASLVEQLSREKVFCDERCSFHVHFDVSKLSKKEIVSIIYWWIKIEVFLMDMMPAHRKLNQFCRLISNSNTIDKVNSRPGFDYFLNRIGRSKYFTLNMYHYFHERRKSIEFRIMDNKCCVSSKDCYYYIFFLHHFIYQAVVTQKPKPYKKDFPFTGFCWLDPKDVFSFLGFDKKELPEYIISLRKWVLQRLKQNIEDCSVNGIFSKKFRNQSIKETYSLLKKYD